MHLGLLFQNGNGRKIYFPLWNFFTHSYYQRQETGEKKYTKKANQSVIKDQNVVKIKAKL